jgi:hypothetical protein
MANHRSAAEKSPSESLTTERPHTCPEKTHDARERKRIPAENCPRSPVIVWATSSGQFSHPRSSSVSSSCTLPPQAVHLRPECDSRPRFWAQALNI